MKTINTSKQPVKRNRRLIFVRMLSYAAAALIALQPFMELEINTANKPEVTRFIIRIFITVMIAVAGKYLKDQERIGLQEK